MSATVRTYRDLLVWQRAMDLVVVAYQVSKRLPKDELYGFLSIANGSLFELETHILASQRLGFLDGSDVNECLTIASETGKMLAGLRRSLENRKPRSRFHRPPTTDHRPL